MTSALQRVRSAARPVADRVKPLAKSAIGTAVRSRSTGNTLTPEVWGLDRDEAGRLRVQSTPVTELVERHG